MQKCSLCGGRVVNGRCEECGMPIPPERTYTLRGESAHYHQVNGEDVLHRVRPSGSRPKVNGYDEEERTTPAAQTATMPRPGGRSPRRHQSRRRRARLYTRSPAVPSGLPAVSGSGSCSS